MKPGRRLNAMKRLLKLAPLALLAILAMVPAASAQHGGVFFRGGFGGGFRGGYYGGFYAPGYFGFYGPGPWVWGYWGSPYGLAYGPRANSGDVKIETKMKDASVYVDGGLIGKAEKVKKFALKTGEHDIELRDPSGNSFYQEHIQVLPGRTVEIQPDSSPGK
jgi:hypothetical protein